MKALGFLAASLVFRQVTCNSLSFPSASYQEGVRMRGRKRERELHMKQESEHGLLYLNGFLQSDDKSSMSQTHRLRGGQPAIAGVSILIEK